MKIVGGIEHRIKELEAMERVLKMRVNMFVSDLFFNIDLTDAIEEEKEGISYNHAQLREQAEWLLSTLQDIGCTVDLPTADELVEDFLGRI